MSRRAASITLLAFAFAATLTTATSVRQMTLDDLVRESDWIVVGKPISSYSAWDQDHRLIWTYTTIEVSDSIKGAAPRQLVVAELGGKVGVMNLAVAGAPRFLPGEQSLLFLIRTPSQKVRVLGLFQGKMQVSVDPSTGEPVVSTTVAGTTGRVTLDNYRRQIRSLLTR